jgi:hypothetical protein
MKEELKKMPVDTPIYLGHLKPLYQSELIKEIQQIGNENIHILDQDGLILNFT